MRNHRNVVAAIAARNINNGCRRSGDMVMDENPSDYTEFLNSDSENNDDDDDENENENGNDMDDTQ